MSLTGIGNSLIIATFMTKMKPGAKIINGNVGLSEGKSLVSMTDLLSFRLHSTANLLSRSAGMRYKRDFGVTLWEWRTMALVGGQPGILFKDLAKIGGLDKSQASRVVAGLSERGLLFRSIDENDGRGLSLSLTRAGQHLYEGLIQAAAERNKTFLDALDPQERRAVETALVKLERLARELIAQEKARGGKE
jgi:DNA-binding MarR family transcriptional regulator